MSNQTKTVPCYGIHWDDEGIAWYIDGKNRTNAYGMRKICPFYVTLAGGRKHCNHSVPFASPVVSEYAWAAFLELAIDPIVEVMLPIPKEGTQHLYWIDDQRGTLGPILATLALMSAPIHPIVVGSSQLKIGALSNFINDSNIEPLVYLNFPGDRAQHLHDLAGLTVMSPRTVILTGSPEVPVPKSFKRIQPSGILVQDYIRFAQLPWPQLGATVVKRYMKNEWPPKKDANGRYVFDMVAKDKTERLKN